MNYKVYSLVITTLIFLSPTVFACKMSPIAASSSVLTAIVVKVEPSGQRNRDISKIRKIAYKSASWAYVVETTESGRNCKATGYQASIGPSCGVTVQKLSDKFQCE
jgi:hypothetical protein